MTAPPATPESVGDSQSDGEPFLPPSTPLVSSTPAAPAWGNSPADSPDAPVLPGSQQVAAVLPVAEPAAFDAKAMIESQKHVVQAPVYGAIPIGTLDSVAAAEALRVEAQRKWRRNRTIVRLIALVTLGGVGTAGWFGYQAFQADQDQLDADREAAQADGSAGAPGALTPLGNQQGVIDAVEDANSGVSAGAGGLVGAVDDARAAVEEINRTEAVDDSSVPVGFALVDVRPEPVVRLGTRLESLGGYERHVIDTRQLASDSPAEYARFVALMQALTQVDPEAITFDVLPAMAPGEIGFAIARDGDRVIQAIIASADPPIHVDYAP